LAYTRVVPSTQPPALSWGSSRFRFGPIGTMALA